MCRRSEPSLATSRNVFWILLFQLILAASVAWGQDASTGAPLHLEPERALRRADVLEDGKW